MFVLHTNARRRALSRFRCGVSVGALIAALATGFALSGGPAWADGGIGRGVAGGGPGGVDGSSAEATGQAGGASSIVSTVGSGGGGAVDLTTGNGAAGGAQGPVTGQVPGSAGVTGAAGLLANSATTISTAVTGGTGGAGQAANAGVNSQGGGGGGGVGVSATADTTITGTGVVTGGMGAVISNGGGGGGGVGIFSSANVTVEAGGRVTGGSGNTTLNGLSGGGGEGAAAIVLTAGGTVQNSGILLGGNGEQTITGGGGGGGAGVQLLSGGTVINSAGATITGGTGRSGDVGDGGGGTGIKGSDISIVNAGVITGGMGAGTLGRADAVQFTGGVNSLELQAGSTITGNAVAFSTADTLKLGGDTDASFDMSQIGPAAQYQGFGLYEKTDTSTWTLTGTTTAVTPWTLDDGILQISSDSNLGDPSGGLIFNGGTLETTADITSARSVTLAADGTFLTDSATTLTLGGGISGPGGLTKAGAGILVLTGANTYSGTTTISAGALQGGATNAFSSSSANIVAVGAQLDLGGLNQTIGSLSGAGTVTNSGALPAVLTTGGDNTSTTFFGVIQDDAVTGVTKAGSGTFTLTGVNTYSGGTTVAAGTLIVNGSAANSAVTVQSGATLGGSGTVGATTIQSGGTIAPGNSIGTLHVNGAFVQAAGSLYQVEVDPTSNASDLISVNGTATLAGGAGLDVVKTTAGDYQIGTKYTVLSATGGVNGTYTLSGDTQTPSPYLALQDVYDAKNVYLEVVQTADPATAAQTPNQTATATGTDSLPANSGVGTAVLNTTDAGATRGAFDQLSGDALASAKGALVSGSLLVRDTTFDRLRDVFCDAADSSTSESTIGISRPGCVVFSDRPAVWVQGFGDWGHVNGNANAAGISQSTGGFLVGADVPVYDWRLGVFGGYSRTAFNVDARDSWGVSDNYHLGLYGGTQWGDIGLRLGASYSWNDVATDRLVAFDDFSNQLQAVYNAGTTQIFGEVGERFSVDQFDLEPFANLAYVNLRTGGFSETGGDAALTSQADTMEDTFTTLGVRPSTGISWGGFNATVRGMLGWRHTFGDVTPSSIVSFAGSNTFTVDGAPIARDAGVAEAGLDFNVFANITAGLTYGGQFSSRQTDNSIRGTVAVTF